MSQKYYQVGEAAEYLGIHPDTLKRWELAGFVTPLRSPYGYRMYSQEMLDALLQDETLEG